jgi:hypothetical protein
VQFPEGNPNVLLSSSVDGTVRQHDIRERCKGQCQKVMVIVLIYLFMVIPIYRYSVFS